MLDGHELGAYYISWSPDDQHLIVCGPEDCNELCVWDIEVTCVHKFFSYFYSITQITFVKMHKLPQVCKQIETSLFDI